MSKNERNEELWRLAVEIEAKEMAPTGQRNCSAIQDLRRRFNRLEQARGSCFLHEPREARHRE